MTDIPQGAKSGGCLCKAVRFYILPPFRDIVACHCRQCRKSSGHFVAATSVPPARFILSAGDELRWYRASDKAQRGFCGKCGSSLFWRPDSADRVSIFAGALDDTSGLRLVSHIYAADKGDYYQLGAAEGVAIHQAGSNSTAEKA